MMLSEERTNSGDIKAILLDWGGVLMRTIDPRPRRELERRFGLERFGADRLVFGHPLWDQAQLGHIASDEVWADIGRHLGLDGDGLDEFRARFWAGDQLDGELVALMRSLREAGYRLGLLSNNPASLCERIKQLLPGVFDAVVISGIEGLMKPEREIFSLALRKLVVGAYEAVFVDDFGRNVVAARESGLHAVRFRGLAPLRIDLRALGVAVPDLALSPLFGVRAVIFDWGGVLERQPAEAYFAHWGPRLELDPGDLQKVLLTEQVRTLARGGFSMAKYTESVADRLRFPSADDADLFISDLRGQYSLIAETVAAARALRGTYRTGLLSNAVPGQDVMIRDLYGIDVHTEFDAYVNSSHVGLSKPDPAVFELALQGLGVLPEQAIVVDDVLRNIDAARAVGISTVHFVDAATSLAELRALLGHSW